MKRIERFFITVRHNRNIGNEDLALITLLTDFGLTDNYVGIMKGVILGINPSAILVDLSHHVPPQDIQTASFQLTSAFSYFPTGTIHLVVVDPGVGSEREAIAVDLEHGTLVGPNNGVFHQLLAQVPAQSAVRLDNTQYWLNQNPSTTFHGRDIFAPAAAHLSQGVPIEQIGSPLPLNQIAPPSPASSPTTEGHIQAIDHFGNLITTLPSHIIDREQGWGILLGTQWIPGHSTYSDVATGKATALIGSHGWVEIAINQGSAQAQFQVQLHDWVQLKYQR